MNAKKLFVVGLSCIGLALTAAADLVGHWTFDEGAGTTIIDSSGKGNHGTLTNLKPGTWTNGTSGSALYFDGTTGAGATYVRIPDALSLHLTNAISFAAWVRCDDIGRDAPILDKEGDGKLSYWFGAMGMGEAIPGNFGILLSKDGNQPWTLFDRDQGLLSQGLWVHIASTWDGATTRHYLNGVLLAQTAAFGGPIHVSDADLIIGANVPYNSTAFKGIVDDARLYNHALSLSEVQALAGINPQMVGHWTFDEGSGTNITDSSGFGNHGTIINLRTNTWTNGVIGRALYFDGSTGSSSTIVAIPDAPSLHIASAISFAAWVRCDDITRDAPIVVKEDFSNLSYWFGAYGAGTDGGTITPHPGNFGVLLNAGNSDTWTVLAREQGTIPQGHWVHLASTWDGSTIRHYINGRVLPETANFTGPIHYSSAFLAIGENSQKNFTAFKGIIDDVRLYNYAIGPDDIAALYLAGNFKITAMALEGNNVRITWQCLPGRSYVVQTNLPTSTGGLTSAFADVAAPIAIPSDFVSSTTNFLHSGGGTNASARYYRVKLLP